MKTTAKVEAALNHLRQGELVAFPTETVYGLGADAMNPEAVAKVFAAKGRPVDHPLIVHIASVDELPRWAKEIPPTAKILADAFWPGPLTLVLPKLETVPDIVTGQRAQVALRVPNHPLTLKLLKAFGGGLVGPSANRYQRISPTQADDVREELGNRAALILDGGPCQLGIESTIVACEGHWVKILRLGSVSLSAIRSVLSGRLAVKAELSFSGPAEASLHKMPGSDRVHYAPQKPVYLGVYENLIQALILGHSIRVLSFQKAPPHLPRHCQWKTVPLDPLFYGQRLYGWLRAFDHSNLESLWIENVPNDDAWSAIGDRLHRAAS